MHYLDNSATTRVCPEAAEAALQAMTVCFGNPSSTHTVGREAKKLLDSSRASVAGALGCQPHDLVFTSCGSESDNWALLAGAEYGRRKGRHIISSEAEHDAVRRSLDLLEERGFEVTKLKPDRSGAVPPDAVRRALREDTVLVSLMLVNNETGAVTDLPAVSALLREAGSPALLHTDPEGDRCALYPKRSAPEAFCLRRRPGRGAPGRNGSHIPDCGLRRRLRRRPAEACRKRRKNAAAAGGDHPPPAGRHPRASGARGRRAAYPVPFPARLAQRGADELSGSPRGLRVKKLRLEVYVSKSSACKKGGRSHVLSAMGLDARTIDGALRIGLCRFTDDSDIDALCCGLRDACRSLAHR